MKRFGLVLLWLLVIGFCIWQWKSRANSSAPIPKTEVSKTKVLKATGVKWNDSLFKHLPEGIDTTVIVKDSKGNSMSFRQYVILVFNHEAMIYQDRGTWRLHRLTKEANDSLTQNEDVVARRERAAAYRTIDTVQSWHVKLNDIAHTLSLSDHILVLKSKRKMIITRRNKPVATFNIDLGFNPVGNKVTDGDGKTPEGIYNLDMKDEREDKFQQNFWISYPNEIDKEIAKNRGVKPGSNIMIHGTRATKVNAKDWTAGCIALQNKDINLLFNMINSGTIIEIRK